MCTYRWWPDETKLVSEVAFDLGDGSMVHKVASRSHNEDLSYVCARSCWVLLHLCFCVHNSSDWFGRYGVCMHVRVWSMWRFPWCQCEYVCTCEQDYINQHVIRPYVHIWVRLFHHVIRAYMHIWPTRLHQSACDPTTCAHLGGLMSIWSKSTSFLCVS